MLYSDYLICGNITSGNAESLKGPCAEYDAPHKKLAGHRTPKPGVRTLVAIITKNKILILPKGFGKIRISRPIRRSKIRFVKEKPVRIGGIGDFYPSPGNIHALAGKPDDPFDKKFFRVTRVVKHHHLIPRRRSAIIRKLIYHKILTIFKCRLHGGAAHHKGLNDEKTNRQYNRGRDQKNLSHFPQFLPERKTAVLLARFVRLIFKHNSIIVTFESNATTHTMTLIVGLGNSEKQYQHTRHNIGRETLIHWQTKTGLCEFNLDKKLNALVSENKKCVILLPETMMNKSGNAVLPAMRKYKVKPDSLIVVHDDADIELGCTKLSFGKHSAGHKGVESVRRAAGTWDFWRLRIGIQPPLRASLARLAEASQGRTKGGKKKRIDAMKLVLQKFSPAEEQTLKKVRKKICEGLDLLTHEGPERAMNEINQK